MRSCGSQKILVTSLKAGSGADRGGLCWESGWGPKGQARSKFEWHFLSTPVTHRSINKIGLLFEGTEGGLKAGKSLLFLFSPWVLSQSRRKISRRKQNWRSQMKRRTGKSKGKKRTDGRRGTSALKFYLRLFLIIFFPTAYILNLVW